MPAIAGDLEEVATRALEANRVTGAAVGILRGDEQQVVGVGLADRRRKQAVTAETPFLVGSITKVWTATALMQLVDEGRVGLDDLVADHLPELRLASAEATAALTVRHLLDHAGGMDEDVRVAAADRSDAALAGYVSRLPELGQLHPPGELFSYSNSGFVVAGRLLERAGDATYEEVMRRRLLDPLGLPDTFFVTAAARPVATGYRANWRGKPVKVGRRLPRGYGPAGATLAASAADVLRFARLHVAGPAAAGVLGDRERGLMQQPARLMPWTRTEPEGSMGLGWMRATAGMEPVLYHGGGSLGQHCALVVLPGVQAAVAILTNAHSAGGFHAAVLDYALAQLTGGAGDFAPMHVQCGFPNLDPARYAGTYERRSLRVRITRRKDTLAYRIERAGEDVRLATAASGLAALLTRLARITLVPCRDDLYLLPAGKSRGGGTPVAFTMPPGAGPASYMHAGLAALRRTGD